MATITIYADKDAGVRQNLASNTTSSYGTDVSATNPWSGDIINGHAYGGSDTDIIIGFPGSVPSGATISAATLYVYATAGGGGLEVSTISDFNESTATWNDYNPHRSGSAAENPSTYVNEHHPFGTITTVTNAYAGISVLGRISAATRASFLMNGGSPGTGDKGVSSEGTLAMRESSGTSQDPYLAVTYNTPPGTPGAFTAPTAGQSITTTATVTHGTASDAEGDSLTYEIDISSNNGSSWTAFATLSSSVSRTLDFTNQAPSTTTKLRVRAFDGTSYGSYQTSSAFTVNNTPGAPSHVTPSNNQTVSNAAPVTFDWTPSDTNAGDVQSAYALRRKRMP